MKTGDLIGVRQRTRAGVTCGLRVLGLLLEDPRLPRYGVFPLRCRVLSPDGSVTECVEDVGERFEVINEKAR